jgi:hypothetical protein
MQAPGSRAASDIASGAMSRRARANCVCSDRTESYRIRPSNELGGLIQAALRESRHHEAPVGSAIGASPFLRPAPAKNSTQREGVASYRGRDGSRVSGAGSRVPPGAPALRVALACTARSFGLNHQQVSSVVEQRPDKPYVAGSTPALAPAAPRKCL